MYAFKCDDSKMELKQMTKNFSSNTKLFIILLIMCISISCNIVSLSTNYWTCSGPQNYGLWNSCFRKNNSIEIFCAHQSTNQIEILHADINKIDQIKISKGLLILSTILNLCSLTSIGALIWSKSNLNLMRNMFVFTIGSQIISIYSQLIGFFMFILTEKLSTSTWLLLLYFMIAICTTNILNFFTIRYRTLKKMYC
jgi:hypothetical protein